MFNDFKKFMFKEDEKEAPAVATPDTKPVASPINTISFGGSVSAASNVVEAAPSGDYVEHLEALNNGDFKTFVEAFKSVEALPITEELKFQTVVAMKGISAEAINTSGLAYLTILENEKAEFDKQLESSNQDRVVAKEAEITTLQEQIAQATQKIATLQQEVTANKTKLIGKAAGFEGSYKMVVNKVNDQLNKLKLYVKSSN